MKFTYAITRRPGKNFALGLTTPNLDPPDYHLILQQHRSYVDTLKSIGLKIIELHVQPDYPDAHFVEDTAVVTPDVQPEQPAAPAIDEAVARIRTDSLDSPEAYNDEVVVHGGGE